jgi:DNA-binding MarR family transcriptional regulator
MAAISPCSSHQPAGRRGAHPVSAPHRVWLRLHTISAHLPALLDAQLRKDSGLTLFEYYVLAMLSESPDHSRPMSDLAMVTHGSLPRLSHAATRLEANGWLVRTLSSTSRRSTIATLTEAGHQKLVASAPGHIQAVRRLIFDRLFPGDISALNASLEPLAVALLPPQYADHFKGPES